ncbi:hypothetical protein FACS1894104_1450 [Actinomycetota bacterium]|nr:hypothetical protein FACS1894104_1450 [Actinomycetota bacterium]
MKESKKSRSVGIASALVLVVGVAIFLVACGNNSSGNVAGENSNSSDSSSQPQGLNSNGNYDGLFLGWSNEPDKPTMDASGTNNCWLDADLFVRFEQENNRPSDGSYTGQELTLRNKASSDPSKVRSASQEEGEYPGYGMVYYIGPQPGDYELSYDGGTIKTAGIWWSSERGIMTEAEFEALSK